MMRVIRCLPVYLLCLCLGACSFHSTPKPTAKPPQREKLNDASYVWQSFAARAYAAKVGTGPFRLSASLRYTDKHGESTRVSSLLWGNGDLAVPYPLRLDLMAGVGTVVAKNRESDRDFTAYSPDEETAYVQGQGDHTLVSFGVPIPLTLSDLTLLLTGRGGPLFMSSDTKKVPSSTPVEGGYKYALRNVTLEGDLVLSGAGAPVYWSEIGGSGWRIEFESAPDNPIQPKRLRISHPRGYEAVIVVKDLERLRTPFTQTQLDLQLPPGTKQKALEQQL